MAKYHFASFLDNNALRFLGKNVYIERDWKAGSASSVATIKLWRRGGRRGAKKKKKNADEGELVKTRLSRGRRTKGSWSKRGRGAGQKGRSEKGDVGPKRRKTADGGTAQAHVDRRSCLHGKEIMARWWNGPCRR